MKKVSFIVCALLALVLFSCEKYTPRENYVVLPKSYAGDFFKRYPEAKVTSASEPDGDRYMEIGFIDGDGFEKKAVYKDGSLSFTCRYYDVDDLFFQLPLPVIGTYLGLGLHNEEFPDGKYAVYEIDRGGICQKQYEFHCLASFKNGDRTINNMWCHVVISEDGTLLAFLHVGYRYSDRSYDLNKAVDVVKDRFRLKENYPDMEFLGVMEDNMGYSVFVREEGIVKTVKIFPDWGNYTWRETCYSLPRFTVLPEYVLDAIDNYEAEYPGMKLSDILFIESKDGTFYGLTFGTALNYHRFYLKVE